MNMSRPIISFSTSKGGSGKTTLCIALAGVLADEGGRVAMIDTDPQQSLTEWAAKPGRPETIDVFSAQNESDLIDLIEACQKTHHVTIIDVQGRVSELGNTAMAWSKLVVVPVQPSAFDATGAANTIRALATVQRVRRTQIGYAIVMNRMSGAIRSRTAKAVASAFEEGHIPVMGHFLDREAYRVMTASGGTVFTLTDAQAPGLEKARKESQLFALAVSQRVGLLAASEEAPAAPPSREAITGAFERADAHVSAGVDDSSPHLDDELTTALDAALDAQ